MYKSTELQKINCSKIVKKILKTENAVDCERYVDDILNIAYSIGSDYSEKTLESIAETVISSKLI